MAWCQHWHYWGTIVCVKCVQFHSFLTFVIGVMMLVSTAVFMFSVPSEIGFSEIVSVQNVEITMVLAAITVMLLGWAGRRYSKTTERKCGFPLLMLLMCVFALQAYFFYGFIFSDRATLEAVTEFLRERTSVELDPDRYHEIATASRMRTMQQVWNSFALTVQDYECSLPDGGGIEGRLLLETDADTPVWAMNNVTDPNDPACLPQQRAVVCAKHTLFGRNMAAICSATSQQRFESDCTSCRRNYLSEWEVTSNAELFDGDIGVLFCRCLTASLEGFEQWSRYAVLVAASFFAFEFFFIISLIWLVCCGSQVKIQEESESGSEEESDDEDYDPRDDRRSREMQNQAPGITSMDDQVSTVSDVYMLVEVQCPPGAGPGALILVTGPDGRQAQVEIPDGVAPGMFFQCEI